MRKLLSLGYSSLLRRLWMIRNYRPLMDYLQRNHGVGKLRPVMVRRWHRGAKYFRGVDADGALLFIKVDGDCRLLQNEVDAWMHLQQTGDSAHCVGMRFFDFASEYRVAAFHWVAGEPLSSFLRKKPSAEQLCCVMREMASILRELDHAGMVHRDFTPDNLLISPGLSANTVSVDLIDFAFAAIGNAAPYDRLVPLNDLSDLCHGYKIEEFLWDDTYSCLRIFDEIGRAAGVEDQVSRAEVKGRIATRTFSLNGPAARRERVGDFAPGIEKRAQLSSCPHSQI